MKIPEYSDFIILIGFKFLLRHLFTNHRETENFVALIVGMNYHVKLTITATVHQDPNMCQVLF